MYVTIIFSKKIRYLLLFIFIVVLVNVSAQEGAYDCDDNPLDDPSVCKGTINCDNPIYLVCAECIFPGQTEICYDKVDNNCNMDESYQLDLNKATGIDALDISCCDIDSKNVYWKNSNNEIIPENSKIEEGTSVILEVNGTIGCDGKEVKFDVLEKDTLIYQDGPGNPTNPSDPDEGIRATFIYDSDLGYSVAKAQWNLVWYKGDAFSNTVEYVFNATPSDSKLEGELSQVIQVYQSTAGCEIEDAKWSTGYPAGCMKHGQNVDLVVDTIGSECKDTSISFELYEEDGLLGDDFLTGTEYQVNSVTMGQISPTKQTWKATYQLTNDDNNVGKGEYYDLEYYFKAIVGVKEINSNIAMIRICDENDQDCDGICDSGKLGTYCKLEDLCPNTLFCEPVDKNGCSGPQRKCLAYWDCSGVEWIDHCDDEPSVFTRNIGDCTNMVNNPSKCYCTFDITGIPECQGLGIIPTTVKGCVLTEEFPVFTGFNILIVIVLLSLYYTLRKK